MDIYIRVSQVGDRTEDESTDLYEAQCREWADRGGIEIGEVEDDTNVSGSVAVAERGLERLVKRIESGESDGIVTPYLDRFGRDLIEGALALKRISEAGGKLVAVRDGFDSESPGSELTFNLRMAIAQDYLSRVRSNWQAATDRAVKNRVYLPPRIPFGYRKDEDRRLVVAESEAAIVRELYDRRIGGENVLSLLRWLRARCAAEGLRGSEMSRSGLRRVLSNRLYLGEMTVAYGRPDKPRVLRDNHPPILTEAKWEAAQIRHPFSPRNGRAAGARLRGLVFCASCGHRCKVGANGPPEKRRTHYVCTREGCTARGSILTSKLDGYVEGLLQDAAAAVPPDPHVEAVILGDTRYQDAMAAVEEARDAFEEFRDSVETQRTLGIKGFAAGLKIRKDELAVARRELSRIRPPDRRATVGVVGPVWSRRAVEDAINAESNAHFVDRVLLRPSAGRQLPAEERVDVYWIGSDEPAVAVA